MNLSNVKKALAALGDNDINEMFNAFSVSSQYQDFLDTLYQINRMKVNY